MPFPITFEFKFDHSIILYKIGTVVTSTYL